MIVHDSSLKISKQTEKQDNFMLQKMGNIFRMGTAQSGTDYSEMPWSILEDFQGQTGVSSRRLD